MSSVRAGQVAGQPGKPTGDLGIIGDIPVCLAEFGRQKRKFTLESSGFGGGIEIVGSLAGDLLIGVIRYIAKEFEGRVLLVGPREAATSFGRPVSLQVEEVYDLRQFHDAMRAIGDLVRTLLDPS
ncbi:hypothetical protein GCM10011574_02530 [Microbispora bryophytorum]|uniref:Uncharacterized protein n=1 Tax=Microbispora bryophytorum TaxID=1460882 RepID=A0A8H9LAZ7_9ACTN|nr:hypothetical protein GCM10011574_02530 [Microbispora bryophytorum]